MPPQSPSDDRLWKEAEELFKLLEGLHEDAAQPPPAPLSITVDEVSARLYDRLATGLRPVLENKIPTHDAQEILNGTIYDIMRGYANYRERYTLRNYAIVVTRNKISAYFQQRPRYVTVEDETLEQMISEQAVEKDPAEPEEAPVAGASLEELLRPIRVDGRQLSEKEFLVFVLKAANFCVEKKLPEAKLAGLVGLKRTTFRDVYQKARDKIYRQWQEQVNPRRAAGFSDGETP